MDERGKAEPDAGGGMIKEKRKEGSTPAGELRTLVDYQHGVSFSTAGNRVIGQS